jgi:hypothetical protein
MRVLAGLLSCPVAAGGGLNVAAMLETAADVAKAMLHMHAANVLHSGEGGRGRAGGG